MNKLNSSLLIRKKLIDALTKQGFVIDQSKIFIEDDREILKNVQTQARLEKIKQHLKFLTSQNGSIKNFIINGKDIEPEKIQLEFRLVKSGSHEEALFKWWNLIWWSIPYERAYGRQMRFLLWDTYHDKPFGLIGLQSAPLKMKIRDDYLGITKDTRDWWVNMSMNAQRVGALPPYNQLLGGKMVAMALAAKEIREAYKNKYRDYKTILMQREIPAHLLFITTTGAFGKSSIYNRVKFKNDKLIEFLGYTRGSGAFHVPDEIYQDIIKLLKEKGVNVGRGYGYGPSRKRQLLSLGFQLLDLPDFEYHGIKRAFYLIPHVYNLKRIIKNGEKPSFKEYHLFDLTQFWKERWVLKRVERCDSWKSFDANEFWNTSQNLLSEVINA